MAILHVRHKTTYTYKQPVQFGEHAMASRCAEHVAHLVDEPERGVDGFVLRRVSGVGEAIRQHSL